MRVYKSTILGLILAGKADEVLTPYTIKIDLVKNYVVIRQRNWFFIGVNEWKHKFSYIRTIEVDNKVFSSNLHFKVFGNRFSVYGLRNKDAEEIRDLITSKL